MIRFSTSATNRIAKVILGGGIGILPTDTIYGIVGSALEKKAVARIYRLRRRNPKKPMIVLIGDVDDLRLFGIKTNAKLLKILGGFWPGKVSVILQIAKDKTLSAHFKYLHRGEGTLAFRLPKPLWLRQLLKKTGPLVAPSANFEGEPSAKTIREAKKYFGKNADFYLDVGPLKSPPSTILRIEKGGIVLVRKGPA